MAITIARSCPKASTFSALRSSQFSFQIASKCLLHLPESSPPRMVISSLVTHHFFRLAFLLLGILGVLFAVALLTMDQNVVRQQAEGGTARPLIQTTPPSLFFKFNNSLTTKKNLINFGLMAGSGTLLVVHFYQPRLFLILFVVLGSLALLVTRRLFAPKYHLEFMYVAMVDSVVGLLYMLLVLVGEEYWFCAFFVRQTGEARNEPEEMVMYGQTFGPRSTLTMNPSDSVISGPPHIQPPAPLQVDSSDSSVSTFSHHRPSSKKKKARNHHQPVESSVADSSASDVLPPTKARPSSKKRHSRRTGRGSGSDSDGKRRRSRRARHSRGSKKSHKRSDETSDVSTTLTTTTSDNSNVTVIQKSRKSKSHSKKKAPGFE